MSGEQHQHSKPLNAPLRQHWVPKVFLKRFSTVPQTSSRKTQAWLFDLRMKKASNPTLDEIAVKKNLYTLSAADTKNYFVEREFLGNIESTIGPTLDEFANGNDVSTDREHRSKMATFLATLWLRNPGTIKVHKDFIAAMKKSPVVSEDGRSVSVNTGNGDTVWPMAKWNAVMALDHDGVRQMFARSIVNLAPEISQVLYVKPWRLARASEGYFFTSDNPLVVKHHTAEQWGLNSPGVDITIALSPHYALYIGERDSTPEGVAMDLNAGVVEAINYFTLTQTKRFLISAHPFDDVMDLINPVEKK